MSYEKYILIVGGDPTVLANDALLDHPGLTAPLDIGPPRMDLVLRHEPMIPAFDCTELRREPKKRDWEQRKRKRRK